MQPLEALASLLMWAPDHRPRSNCSLADDPHPSRIRARGDLPAWQITASERTRIDLSHPHRGPHVKVDLRVITINVPQQEMMTRDNVPVTVDAVVYFRVLDPEAAIVKVENFLKATSLIAQTTLRSVIGQAELDELLSQREKVNQRLQESY